MAEETKLDVQRFEAQTVDVTCCCEVLCCGSATLEMGEEDVELRKNCLGSLCKSKKRGPYGELGTVDANQCLCFHSFSIGSFMEDGDTKCVGMGCDEEQIDDIVRELKKRQGLRGDRAKTRMGETTLCELAIMQKKIDAIMVKLDVPPIPEEMKR